MKYSFTLIVVTKDETPIESVNTMNTVVELLRQLPPIETVLPIEAGPEELTALMAEELEVLEQTAQAQGKLPL